MNLDINRKKVAKNAYRITKNRKETALRVRVPGGEITGDLLIKVSEIANTYGNGKVHMTTRQGFEIMGIPWDKMDECNELVQSLIDGFNINQDEKGKGYSAAGTRNIASCIGNKVCPKAQYNTTEFAKKIEKAIFPHDFHFKVALTGCPNDCQKVRLHDFGIIGMTLPKFDASRCISCGRCEKKCRQLSTGAIEMKNFKPERNHSKCIGCGECVLNCPASAWTRDENKYYRLAIMGRTGKKNPRLAEDFLIWANEETIIKIILNTYKYVDKYIDRSLPKEHIGYIVDRTGFMEFKKWALDGVDIPDYTVVQHNVYWSGIKYPNLTV
ncbi:MAG: sulfite reductase subunit C [Fusobacteriaceae bacterium]|nr:sulfite reductase subunit C [Fusobacteriaceae bacterium]MBP9595416.1 sulfite reductase subunit C [Fusobacteriaceae bacterium]MBU9918644.1 sulfite reductase subunit C [Fusobacteriaceae bacterium]